MQQMRKEKAEKSSKEQEARGTRQQESVNRISILSGAHSTRPQRWPATPRHRGQSCKASDELATRLLVLAPGIVYMATMTRPFGSESVLIITYCKDWRKQARQNKTNLFKPRGR